MSDPHEMAPALPVVGTKGLTQYEPMLGFEKLLPFLQSVADRGELDGQLGVIESKQQLLSRGVVEALVFQGRSPIVELLPMVSWAVCIIPPVNATVESEIETDGGHYYFRVNGPWLEAQELRLSMEEGLEAKSRIKGTKRFIQENRREL